MHDWLSQRARVTPEREALVVADTRNSWDYGTLDETVDEMAGRLAAHGVGAGDHVGCVLESGAPQVCLIHAAMRLGAVLVPFAPSFTAPELAGRLERADVSVVVCDEETEQQVVEVGTEMAAGAPSLLSIGDPQWTEVTALAALESAAVTPHDWSQDDVQLLLFTSGTTGDPKVVQLTMGNLLWSAVASGFRLGVDPADRWLVPLSLHHMGGIAPVLRSTLYGTTTIVRANFEPGRTVDDIQTHDATAISLVPTMLRRMLSARGTLPDCLRFVLVGGAPCPVELVERCRNFSVPICPTYGMTETASQVATARDREAFRTPATVGRPLMWTDVTVVDPDGDPVPTGESGELVVSGPTVSPGYYGDDAATETARGEFGFHTGDVGRFDEQGRLFVLNRLDDRIVSGGENVDPGEVVDALLTHPEVEEAAVVGLPDEEWGERVGALVVAGEEPPKVAELESSLRERLAGFKLPRTVGFAENLPRTVSGTVEREAVRERLLDGSAGAIEYAESGTEEQSSSEEQGSAAEQGGGKEQSDGDEQAGNDRESTSEQDGESGEQAGTEEDAARTGTNRPNGREQRRRPETLNDDDAERADGTKVDAETAKIPKPDDAIDARNGQHTGVAEAAESPANEGRGERTNDRSAADPRRGDAEPNGQGPAPEETASDDGMEFDRVVEDESSSEEESVGETPSETDSSDEKASEVASLDETDSSEENGSGDDASREVEEEAETKGRSAGPPDESSPNEN